jgi:hypothetical protein
MEIKKEQPFFIPWGKNCVCYYYSRKRRLKITEVSKAPVAHAYNPSYSGLDQED